MTFTNLEFAQVAIEIFAGCVSIMIAILILMNQHKTRSMKLFVWMFFTASLIFFADSAAVLFRGDIGTLYESLTRISNFMVFILNYILANLFVRFLYSAIEDSGEKPAKIYQKIADICFYIAVAILVVNVFTGWMYYFDDSNIYHRNYLWYLYTALSLVCLFSGCIMAVKHRKKFSGLSLVSIIVFAGMPIIAIVVQSFIYGIAIANIGIGFSILFLFISYLVKWSKSDYVDRETDEKRQKMLQIVALFIIMTISMSASIISCLVSIGRISENKSEADSKVIAHMISGRIDSEFERPITVATALSKDNVFLQYIKANDSSAKVIEAGMEEALEAFRVGFDYQMVFAVSEASRAYFTYQGIAKYLDLVNDPHDSWYRDFVESGKDYELNVDTDEVNNWALSVFVNVRVKDTDGKLLGTCGVGVDMTELQGTIAELEKEYQVKITFVNKDGLIQICDDLSKIEVESIDNSYFDNVGNDDFYFEKQEKSNRLTRYEDVLGWYVVIEDLNPNKIDVKSVTTPSIIIFIGGIFMMAIAFGVITIREQKTAKELREKRLDAITDELTGLLNRHAYEEDVAKLEEQGDVSNTTYIMMDLNGLKFVNDNLGHNAGDEYIIGAAQCMRSPFAGLGKVYRIGGDEFVAILDCSKEKAQDAIKTFDHLVKNWKGKLVDEMTISKGIMYGCDHPKMPIRKIIELADRLMYEDKDIYYERTGKKRRV